MRKRVYEYVEWVTIKAAARNLPSEEQLCVAVDDEAGDDAE